MKSGEIKKFTEEFTDKAKEAGFDLVGFTEAEIPTEVTDNLNNWLSKGYHADMEWMRRTFQKRTNPKTIIPEAKSVVSLGINYYHKKDFSNETGYGKISRYAWGKDYHGVIEEKNKILIDFITSRQPDSQSRAFVDYGPTMDKVLGQKAGIGWTGKHTNLINTGIGSWFFISTIITTAEFAYSCQEEDHCGTCTECIEACPTNAITEPYVLDSNKCISYLTIENKKNIPEIFKGKFDNWLFGCDICQDVCPWNIKFATETREGLFSSNLLCEIKLTEISELSDEEEFRKRFEGRAILRARLKGLKRNAEFISE